MKYPIGFCILSIITIGAPYIGGPLIYANQFILEKWGWLPTWDENDPKALTFSENEKRFTQKNVGDLVKVVHHL